MTDVAPASAEQEIRMARSTARPQPSRSKTRAARSLPGALAVAALLAFLALAALAAWPRSGPAEPLRARSQDPGPAQLPTDEPPPAGATPVVELDGATVWSL